MKQNGFSLLEILIYTAIIGIVGTLMTGILISLLKIQNKQIATTEVHQQLNFIILNIQRLVRESHSFSIVDSTLTLEMTNLVKNPTLIYKTGTAIYLKEGASNETRLTTDNVSVDNLQFTKISSSTNYNALQFAIALSYNTENPQRAFSKTITSAVAHFNPED